MKSLNFTFGLWGLFTSGSAQPATQVHYNGQEGVLIITDFLKAVTEGQFEKANLLLGADFKANEPAHNRILTAEELLYSWEADRQLAVHQHFELKKTAIFSVFGDIDRDKYVYIKADWHSLKSGSQQTTTVPLEMIVRIDEGRIAHLLYCFGSNKAFDKLSSVQHARSLAHPC